ALAAGRPAAVGPGPCGPLADDWASAGAPLHAPDGALLGAVGVGTPAADGGPERLVLAAYLAHVIEREIALRHEARREQPGPGSPSRRWTELLGRARALEALSATEADRDAASELVEEVAATRHEIET